MRDVYNEKMDNLRKYIHAEGARSDWIAKDVWYINNHLFFYFYWLPLSIFIILIFVLTGITFYNCSEDNWEYDWEVKEINKINN